jgi:hypothetical protein
LFACNSGKAFLEATTNVAMASLFALTFFFVFGWRITPSLDITVLISLVVVSWVFVVRQKAICSCWLTWSALMMIATLYAILIVILHGAYDAFSAARMLRAIVNLAGGLAIAQLFIERFGDKALEKGVATLFWSFAAHALIMILMYVNDSFRSLVLGVTHATEYVNNPLSLELGLRIPGLTYGLGTTSVLQAFGLFLLAPMMGWSGAVWKRLVLLLAGVLIVISIGLSGRTGLVVGGALMSVIVATTLPIMRVRSVLSVALVLLVLSVPVVLLAARFVEDAEERLGNIAFTLQHVSEVLELLERGESQTTEILANMLFLPEDLLDLMFGTSNSGRGSGVYIPSDIGFILGVFAVGLIGTLLSLSAFLYPLGVAVRRWTLSDVATTAIVAIFLATILMHMKQVALFTRQLWSVQALLGALLVWDSLRRAGSRVQTPGVQMMPSATQPET